MTEPRAPGDDLPTAKNPHGQRPPAASTCELAIIDGPDRGASFVCHSAQPTLIGQSSACEVRLIDNEVSRRHARIDITDDEWRIRDLDSTNGTWLGSVRIVEAHLAPGARLRVGATTFEVRSRAVDAHEAMPQNRFGRLVGESPEMRALYPVFARLAATRAHIVIEGESGAGKELLAESLHEHGPARGAPFMVVGCANASRDTSEAELFGRGEQAGALELARGGTVVLDEIAELDLASQAKLVRALERRTAARVGAAATYPIDVRVIVTSRRDLDREAQAGRLLDELLKLVCVARLELPPLRRRRGDVDVLALHFAREIGVSEIDDEALGHWREDPWPGNVRELRHAVVRRLTLGDEGTASRVASSLAGGGLDAFVADALAHDRTFSQTREELLRTYESVFVERALARHGGSVIRAASAAGLARRYFQVLNARREKPGD